MSVPSKRTSQRGSPLATLMPEARQRIIEFGAPLLATETEGRLVLAERKLRAFEQKYETTLAPLRRDGLPDDASLEMHEDYVEWSGWQRTYEDASRLLASLPLLLEKTLATAPAS